MKRTKRASIGIAIAFLASATTLISAVWVPRFTFEPLNYWFTGVSALAIPASIIWLGVVLSGFWYKALAFVAATLSAVPMLPFGLIAISEASNVADGEPLSRQRLAEVSRGKVAYRLYRTDCGATCAYGLELRKEIDALGVIKLVLPVWSVYREKDAALRLSPAGQVEVVKGEDVLHTEE